MTLLLEKKIPKLPEEPGVYFFKNREGDILYVGKAVSLKSRVRSYFTGDITKSRGEWIARMMDQVADLNYETTGSALEALIKEAAYIKKLQPPFNTRDKDNKSFNYVVITREDYPRVLVKRERELRQDPELPVEEAFGPFPSGFSLREAMKIIRKIFPFRDQCVPYREVSDRAKVRPCFNYSLGLCPGVCAGVITKKEYRRRINYIKKFLKGHKKGLREKLEREMMNKAGEQKFEQAQEIKQRLYALDHIQDISMLKQDFWSEDGYQSGERTEGYDIAHHSGRSMVGVMVVFVNGEADKHQYRKFKIRSTAGPDDTGALMEILKRRMSHSEWQMPDLIVIDGGEAQRRAALRTLKELGFNIAVVSVVKDERHRPKDVLGSSTVIEQKKEEILRVNREAHRFAISYHRYKDRKRK